MSLFNLEPALIILLIVFILIAVRQVGRFRFRIWQVMALGALAVLVTGQITIPDALRSINPDVMIFLLAMFIVGESLLQSGYIFSVSSRFMKKCPTTGHFLGMFIVLMGLFSAILMNDTLAVICTPLALFWSRGLGINPKVLLLSLCFAITTGSVMSPIGNPQNLLVATESGFPNPFVTFFIYLGVPTLVSLLFVYLFIRIVYRHEAWSKPVPPEVIDPIDPVLAKISKISLVILLTGIVLEIVLSTGLFNNYGVVNLPLTAIAVAAALPIIILSHKRMEIIKGIDWRTLVFFGSMFVLMAAVYATGYFQGLLPSEGNRQVPVLFITGVLISQLISNVPFVALFTPMMIQSGISTNQVAAIAAGSTIAGNLTILGAASNVIIIQQAERQGETLSFFEFLKIGLPLTVVMSVLFIAWLMLI
jgi:Na+/H+ antiporter NhaD/arsenite permease-like protein